MDDEEPNRITRLSCLSEGRRHARDDFRRTRDRTRLAYMRITSSSATMIRKQADENFASTYDTYETEVAMTGLPPVTYQDIELNKASSHGRPSSETCRAASSSLYSQASTRQSDASLEILDYYLLSLPPLSPLLSDWTPDLDDGMTMHIDDQLYASDPVQKVLDGEQMRQCSRQPWLESTISHGKRVPDALQKSLPPLPYEANACCRRRIRTYSLFPVVESEHYSLDSSDIFNRITSKGAASPQPIRHPRNVERRQRSDSSPARDILPKSPSNDDSVSVLSDQLARRSSPSEATTSHDESQQRDSGPQELVSGLALHTRSADCPISMRVSRVDDRYSACRWSDESTLNQRSTIATAHNLHLSNGSAPHLRAHEQEMTSSFEHDDIDGNAGVGAPTKSKLAWWRECSHKAGRSTSTLTVQGHQGLGNRKAQLARGTSTRDEKSFGKTLSGALLCGLRSSVT
nr:hypothetical protein CFP56_20693 [Quercus suber]